MEESFARAAIAEVYITYLLSLPFVAQDLRVGDYNRDTRRIGRPYPLVYRCAEQWVSELRLAQIAGPQPGASTTAMNLLMDD
ncbi:hypothetical protein K461DRAFT_277046, partial [Myriangium duriaei CBS 260.36]